MIVRRSGRARNVASSSMSLLRHTRQARVVEGQVADISCISRCLEHAHHSGVGEEVVCRRLRLLRGGRDVGGSAVATADTAGHRIGERHCAAFEACRSGIQLQKREKRVERQDDVKGWRTGDKDGSVCKGRS